MQKKTIKQRRSSRIINPFFWVSRPFFWPSSPPGVQEGQQSGQTHLGPFPMGVRGRPLQEVSDSRFAKLTWNWVELGWNWRRQKNTRKNKVSCIQQDYMDIHGLDRGLSTGLLHGCILGDWSQEIGPLGPRPSLFKGKRSGVRSLLVVKHLPCSILPL